MLAPSNLEEAVEIARGIATTTLAEHAARIDEEAIWPEQGLAALLAAGLGGLTVPRAVGGAGQGLEALLLVCEELGMHCPSTALAYGMHCVASATIAARSNPTLDETLLSPIATGEHLTTLALSEPGSGAHFYFPQTQIVADEAGDYRLNGCKSFVTSGGHADSYVTSAVGPIGDNGQQACSCVVVPKDTIGLRWGPSWRGFGMRGNASRNLSLDNASVAATNLLGKEGDQLWFLFNVVTPYFLIAMAGTYLGLARSAFAETLEYIEHRDYDHCGGSLAGAVVVQHRVGALFGLLESTRCLAARAAEQIDQGENQGLATIFTSKAQVADCAVTIVNECMTLIGGSGYGSDRRMQQRLRDVRAAHVMSPTTDILRIWTGRALLDQPLLGGLP